MEKKECKKMANKRVNADGKYLCVMALTDSEVDDLRWLIDTRRKVGNETIEGLKKYIKSTTHEGFIMSHDGVTVINFEYFKRLEFLEKTVVGLLKFEDVAPIITLEETMYKDEEEEA